jgi:hypothetical protein
LSNKNRYARAQGHRLEAFLPELLTLLVCLLEGAARALPDQVPQHAQQAANEPAAEEPAPNNDAATDREIRGSALRLLAALWRRFPAAVAACTALWPRFFVAVAPLMPRMVVEASSERLPPLLEAAAALAAAPDLAPLLADSIPSASPAGDTERLRGCNDPWACDCHLGSQLLAQAIAVLAAGHASGASRSAALGIVESILDLGEGLAEVILQRHTQALLEALRQLVTAAAAATSGGGGAAKRAAHGLKVHKPPHAIVITTQPAIGAEPPRNNCLLYSGSHQLFCMKDVNLRYGGDIAGEVKAHLLLCSRRGRVPPGQTPSGPSQCWSGCRPPGAPLTQAWRASWQTRCCLSWRPPPAAPSAPRAATRLSRCACWARWPRSGRSLQPPQVCPASLCHAARHSVGCQDSSAEWSHHVLRQGLKCMVACIFVEATVIEASCLGAGEVEEEDVGRYATALAPLASSLGGREARAALASAFTALAGLQPDLAPTAELLTKLNAMSATEVWGRPRPLSYSCIWQTSTSLCLVSQG